MKKKICLLLSCMLCIMGISNVSAAEDKVNDLGPDLSIVEFPEQIVSNQKNYITVPSWRDYSKVYYQQVEISKETYDELVGYINDMNVCYEAKEKYNDYSSTEDTELFDSKRLNELKNDYEKKCESIYSNYSKLEEAVPKYNAKNWVETKKEVIDGKNKYEISSSSYSYGVYYVKLDYGDGTFARDYVIYSSKSTSTSTTETEVKTDTKTETEVKTDTKTETTTEVKENTVKNPKTGMNNAYLVLPVVAGVGVLAFLVTRRKNKFPQA